MMMKTKKIFLLPIIAVLVTFIAACPQPIEEKVGVLLLSWPINAGFCPEVSWNIQQETFIGDVTEYEGQECKFGHVGEFPQEMHIGWMPWMLWNEEPGWEYAYDSSGIYQWIEDGGYYESIDPNNPSLTPAEIPSGIPILPMTSAINNYDRQSFPPDSRTGEDLLEGWFIIGSRDIPFGNGLCDLYESTVASYIRMALLMEWSDELGEENCRTAEEAPTAMFDRTKELLADHFGDLVDARVGFYVKTETGGTKNQRDVAEDFANEGFRRMLITRETTDYNRFANDVVGKNYVKERLCEIGVLDDFELQQTRQVGRTPEFNALNIKNLKNYIEAYPEGSTIAMIYVTYGGGKGYQVINSGPLASPYEWHKEMREENAYLNYLSWKKSVRAAYGDRYNLVFTKGGVESDLREDNFWTFGMLYSQSIVDGYLVSEVIQFAKEDGHDKIIIAPCHWYYDCEDTLIKLRERYDLPLQPKGAISNHEYDITWCEESDRTWVDCGSEGAVAEITLAQAYSNLIEDFATCYYVRLRGGLEKFGLYPNDADIRIEASEALTKLGGGTVEATGFFSAISGAKIEIPADPYPGRPDDFTWDTWIPLNDPEDTMDCLWEDLTVSIGVQSNPPAMQSVQAIGPAVHVGPYRTLFNRDVTITIPYDTQVEDAESMTVYIYNHLTEDWEALEAEDVDLEERLVTFKTKVLGLFQVGLSSN
jgi:hypothetical protein